MASATPLTPPNRSLGKSYEPHEFESASYAFWESSGCFEASDTNAPGQESFAIVIPPPNVTGVLHMGHALTNTIQDILIRWRRMKGDNALWLPGTDHAGIATQAVVEKAIAKEGKGPSGRPLSRHDLGRKAFVERTWKWKEDHGSQITGQLKRLGSSLDWKRERFTMDEGLSKAVREVFVRLYEEKLIYRGERIINWCPKCQTALSDLEVVPTERKGSFFHLVYKIVEKDGKPVKGPDGAPAQLVIATTRPETLLGDTAVAVHPEDERYTHLHGKFAVLPLTGRLIPVLVDEYVDREFGSGALKITPAHDFNDYELGKKHGLPFISVIGKDGRITEEGAPYAGLKVFTSQGLSEARTKVVEDLQAQGLLVRTEDHVHKVGLCQRSDTVAEPIISKQWFVKIQPLADPAIAAVKTGKIEFSPKSWEKTYFEWMNNIRDWCISRQLWWGHQIPAFYCGGCSEITVARENPTKCAHCGGSDLTQDEDVLDTWFSSGLWPFSTLGWPNKTKALETFYPTAILETGFDIIFFWVARMIMMGIHFMGDVPFKKVYLHAMVRDEKGEKMSKSKGNVIDPLDVIKLHGADPLRFTLTSMAGQGRDIKLSVDRVENNRAFCNKIWNATKFLHMQLDPALGPEGGAVNAGPLDFPAEGLGKWIGANRAKLSAPNRWILSRLFGPEGTIARIESGFEKFELNESAQAIYEFAWHDCCDWFIELSKLPLREGGDARRDAIYTLAYVLETLMKAAHPVMPFVTEELWLSLPGTQAVNTPGRAKDGKPPVRTIMLQTFPQPRKEFKDAAAEAEMADIMTVVQAIRNFRGENSISPKTEFAVKLRSREPAALARLEKHASTIRALARVTALDAKLPGAASDAIIILGGPLAGSEMRIDLAGLVNVAEELKRLEKDMERVQADVDFVATKLGKESFIAKAPPALVDAEKAKLAEHQAKLEQLKASAARMKALAR